MVAMATSERVSLCDPATTAATEQLLYKCAPWASTEQASIAARAARGNHNGAGGDFNDTEIRVRPRGMPDTIGRLLRCGFVRKDDWYVLTREAAPRSAIEIAPDSLPAAEAQKPENRRRFDVAVWLRGCHDLPAELVAKPDYITAARWAAKRLADPENDYTRAVICVYDGTDTLLLREELRLTRKETYRRPVKP